MEASDTSTISNNISRKTIILIAKEPIVGNVKTRLVPPLTYEQAAELADSALLDTIDTIKVINSIDSVLYFQGDPKKYSEAFTSIISQCDGDFSKRLSFAFMNVSHKQPAMLVAMDTPQITNYLLSAFDPIKFDACIGMTTDGGYWIIGFRNPDLAKYAFSDIAMSTNETGKAQLNRLKELNLNVQILDTLTDFDDIESAHMVYEMIPSSRFGHTFKKIIEELD